MMSGGRPPRPSSSSFFWKKGVYGNRQRDIGDHQLQLSMSISMKRVRYTLHPGDILCEKANHIALREEANALMLSL